MQPLIVDLFVFAEVVFALATQFVAALQEETQGDDADEGCADYAEVIDVVPGKEFGAAYVAHHKKICGKNGRNNVVAFHQAGNSSG